MDSYLEFVISIHALLAESDVTLDRLRAMRELFLSTLSLRRATNTRGSIKMKLNNFYPRSPCGERLDVNNPVAAVTSISIHALLAESDGKSQSSGAGICISIHALLAESDF